MKIVKFNIILKKFVSKHSGLIFLVFSFLSFSGFMALWWLSVLSLIFFIWNFFNEKRYFKPSIVFSLISILSLVFYIFVVVPSIKWSDKVQAEWNTPGYDSTARQGAQSYINVINRCVEGYKYEHGVYPKSLGDIRNVLLFNLDFSYRIKEPNGKVRNVPFVYKRIGKNKFFLAGVGKDGLINTKDDLLPQISKEQEKTTGLVRYNVKYLSPEEIKYENQVIKMLGTAKVAQEEYNTK